MKSKKIGTIGLMKLVNEFQMFDGFDSVSYERMSKLGNTISDAYDKLSKWQKRKLGQKCEEIESVIMTSKTVYNALKFEA